MLDTTRKVATPEGIELTLRLAGPVPRAMAWAVDLAIRAGIVFAVMSVALQFGRAGWGVVLLTLFFVEWLLPAWLEAAWRGQTPGKRVMRLAVLNDDGTPVRWPAALTRNLLRAVDFLPFLYGVGLVSMLASRDFKRLVHSGGLDQDEAGHHLLGFGEGSVGLEPCRAADWRQRFGGYVLILFAQFVVVCQRVAIQGCFFAGRKVGQRIQ